MYGFYLVMGGFNTLHKKDTFFIHDLVRRKSYTCIFLSILSSLSITVTIILATTVAFLKYGAISQLQKYNIGIKKLQCTTFCIQFVLSIAFSVPLLQQNKARYHNQVGMYLFLDKSAPTAINEFNNIFVMYISAAII